MVTCRLTACTPGSAPGPTLGIEYGKAFSLFRIWAPEFSAAQYLALFVATNVTVET